MSSRRPEYLGEPTLAQVMRRPRWILALLLALVIAGLFAWLGRWQMDNAIRHNFDDLSNTETVRPIDELTEPTPGIPEIAAGAVVSVDGSFVAGDYSLVSGRLNSGSSDPESDLDRASGTWVVGHLVRDDDANLAVAIGWAPSDADALEAIEYLDEQSSAEFMIEGHYLPPEAAEVPARDEDPHLIRSMQSAYLLNLWAEAPTGPTYGGYLVLHNSGVPGATMIQNAGLVPIDSVAPGEPERVSWLNVFYAIEWIVFGVVALFLWYRLARDAWEKEHEIMLLTEAEASESSASETRNQS